MHDVYLLTGSNLGDRARMLSLALQHIREKVGRIVRRSSVYQTEPWGFEDHRPFLNQAIRVKTRLSPSELLSALLQIELVLGRIRQADRYVSRVIDIDILFYDQLILSHKHLTIPHPLLHARRFVLAPMAEIAPDLEHPVLGMSITELLLLCPDPLQVEAVQVGAGYGLTPRQRGGR
ncbi:MAG TPA: 2-amino-4-hydroxy-6-hydroxymethyldihydropteridine diphosphokinase [Bacteroidales bacterium]|nr:2-amino-4-hydroxy-6-hydroxymethyldihydropteridine diphosphokinase [Bacteroidales bacterium]